jgi:hypothetical protein
VAQHGRYYVDEEDDDNGSKENAPVVDTKLEQAKAKTKNLEKQKAEEAVEEDEYLLHSPFDETQDDAGGMYMVDASQDWRPAFFPPARRPKM